MEFTIAKINEAHQLYTGPDFPKLIREFKKMGMVTNIFNLKSGVVAYINRAGVRLEDKGIQVDFEIRKTADALEALSALQRNQRGITDFYTFCNEIAKAGVYQWISDLDMMTCTYYDQQDTPIISEAIPTV